MKSENRIFLITFIAFACFVFVQIVITVLHSYVLYPELSFTDSIFNSCLASIDFFTEFFGIDFRTFNVVIFCFLVPVAFIGMFVHSLYLRHKLNSILEESYLRIKLI